jgi:hypothetical protein
MHFYQVNPISQPLQRTRRTSRSVTVMALCLLAACSSVASPTPFTTDGCSLFPDRSITGKTDWCDCCLAHDLAYWKGGTAEDRLTADKNLKACVEQKTKDHALAETMYLGVRAGGGPQVKSPFRWGYAWPYGRGYQALTPDELAAVKLLEDAYLAQNPLLVCKAPKPTSQLQLKTPQLASGLDTPPISSR